MRSMFFLLFAGVVVASVHGAMSPIPDGPIVQLFEWRFDDIAEECVKFLSPKGFGGVQVSPVNENVIIEGRPWYERYQPISYAIDTRSGNRRQFEEMVRTCNSVGVKIYVDVVFNHMAAGHTTHDDGTAGGYADTVNMNYPSVPYKREHFHEPCGIDNWKSAWEVRNCELLGLRDLNQTQEYVRDKMVEYLNELLSLGVAGFRVDAVKHMDPDDVDKIFKATDNVNPNAGFVSGARPYVYVEFFGNDEGELHRQDYLKIGAITDFKYAVEVSRPFRNANPFRHYNNFGETWGLIDDAHALVFVDNHDTQRGQYGQEILTHNQPDQYKMANAFMLSWPYGQPALMSSYKFDNYQDGPPCNEDETIQRVQFCGDHCTNRWLCEHRWRQIANMVTFRKVVGKEPVLNWWDNENNMIAFSRGNKGFIVFNPEENHFDMRIKTGLPPGRYCDVISGNKVGEYCSGKMITVDGESYAQIYLPPTGVKENGILAIHVGAKL